MIVLLFDYFELRITFACFITSIILYNKELIINGQINYIRISFILIIILILTIL